jgi:hypothetical protein
VSNTSSTIKLRQSSFYHNEIMTFSVVKETATKIIFVGEIDPSDCSKTAEISISKKGGVKIVKVDGRKTADNWMRYSFIPSLG